jgi:hypothetical protein
LSDFDCTGTCESVCDCTGYSSKTCVRWGASFDVGPANPQNEAACDELSTQMSTVCSQGVGDGLCHKFARAERSEAAAMYLCAASKVRDGDCETPFVGCRFPAEQLGTTLCNEFSAHCYGDCPLNAAEVDDDAGWLRDDVRSAASACLGLSECSHRQLCLEAWQGVAFPQL